MKIMTTSTWRAFLSLFLLMFVGVMAGCAGEQEETDDQSQAVTVDAQTVSTRSLQETTQAIGTLRADRTARIRPEINGILESIEFSEGETVAKNEVLFELEDDQLKQQVQAREASLREARAQLKNAKRTYERQQRLYQKELTSAQDRDNALEAYEIAQARVQRLEAQLSEARERLMDATIRAPYAGVMGSHRVDEGNFVQPGQHLTTLYRTARLRVNFTVPERLSGRVKQGQSVRVSVNSLPGDTFSGSVYYVSPSVNELTRDLTVKAYISNSDRLLKPGMFARVNLVLETLKKRPVVPARALVATREGYFVFRLEDGVAQRQPVEIGLRQPGLVEIREGLEPGDKVVTAGQLSLTDGTKVQVQNGASSRE
jgi:membrane fusion protein (multidrug efflux system)